MGGSHDIPKLEQEIKGLHDSTRALAKDDGFVELLKLIHQPGYTTPAEFKLVNALVISMSGQVRELTRLKESIVVASREIVEAHERIESMV